MGPGSMGADLDDKIYGIQMGKAELIDFDQLYEVKIDDKMKVAEKNQIVYGFEGEASEKIIRKEYSVQGINSLALTKKDSVVDGWRPAESAMKMISKSTLLNFDDDEEPQNIASPYLPKYMNSDPRNQEISAFDSIGSDQNSNPGGKKGMVEENNFLKDLLDMDFSIDQTATVPDT